MKKTIIALFALAELTCAESIGYGDMTPEQQSEVKYHWDNSQTVNSNNTPWAEVPGVGTSFTVSFDISAIKDVQVGETLLSLAGSHLARGWDDGTLQMSLNADKDLIITNYAGGNSYSQFFDGSQRGDTSTNPNSYVMGGTDLGLNAADSLTSVTTLTFVSDASTQTFTMYNNGVQVAQQTGWNTDTGVTGLQLGERFGGGDFSDSHKITGSAVFDNFTVWNRALSSTEVQGLVIPEPATATLSLLALAGLAARRRRK